MRSQARLRGRKVIGGKVGNKKESTRHLSDAARLAHPTGQTGNRRLPYRPLIGG